MSAISDRKILIAEWIEAASGGRFGYVRFERMTKAIPRSISHKTEVPVNPVRVRDETTADACVSAITAIRAGFVADVVILGLAPVLVPVPGVTSTSETYATAITGYMLPP